MRTPIAVVTAAFLLGAPRPAGHAQSAPPAGTGTIVGRVTLAGAPPPAAPLRHDHDAHVCGARSPIPDERLVVAADGGLAGAVVILEGVAAGAVADGRATLDQKNCTFVPHVQSVTVGTTLTIGNSDPVLHNVHGFLAERTLFNLAMPVPGQRVDRRLSDPGVVRIQCDSGHRWMSAYIAVVPHALHATTAADGAFTITGVPPGAYVMQAWHEQLGTTRRRVTVSAGGTSRVSFTYRAGGEPERAATERTPVVGDPLRRALQQTRTEVDLLAAERMAERRDQARRAGRPLYVRYCATCHGADGDGRGPSARYLRVPPRDFTKGVYKFRMTPAGMIPTEQDLVRTIAAGVVGTGMPSWSGTLSRDQIGLLARHVMSYSDRFWKREPPPPRLHIPSEPPADAASIGRGAGLYRKMQCAACHGESGRGNGPAAAALRDDAGVPIRPHDFTRPWAKGGYCGACYYRTISTGLAGTPMPAFAGSLTPAERWDLVHYLESLRRRRGVTDYLFRDPAGRMTTP